MTRRPVYVRREFRNTLVEIVNFGRFRNLLTEFDVLCSSAAKELIDWKTDLKCVYLVMSLFTALPEAKLLINSAAETGGAICCWMALESF